jgi:hypothetical protein
VSYCAEVGISGRIEVAASVGKSAGIATVTGRLASHCKIRRSNVRHSLGKQKKQQSESA